ncbi:MAG: cupredoxin domain-containing protein [Chloroflexota bacterium]
MRRLVMIAWLLTALSLVACSAPADTSGPQTITLEASLMKFQPATLEVTAGRPVILTFINKDTVDHDFTVAEIPVTGVLVGEVIEHAMAHGHSDPDLHVVALAGKSNTLEFTPTQPGTYEFTCTVAGHKEAGMVGTLVVK